MSLGRLSMGIESNMEITEILLSERDNLSFLACLKETAQNKAFVQEFDRLKGTSLSGSLSPIEKMIDEATGKKDADLETFIRFVYETVFCRVDHYNKL